MLWVRGRTSSRFQDKQGVVWFSCRSKARNSSLVLYEFTYHVFTCRKKKQLMSIIMTIVYRLQLQIRSPVKDGIGPIPQFGFVLHSEWMDCLSYLYFPPQAKIRNMMESILSLQTHTQICLLGVDRLDLHCFER